MAVIRGDNGPDDIYGTSTGDNIFGYGGDDIIYGYGGNDRIEGGAGNDDIWGGTGANDLYGGSGSDYFIASALNIGPSDDYIVDFEFDIDKIDLAAWGVSDLSQVLAMTGIDVDGNAFFNAVYNGFNHFFTINGVRPNELQSNDFQFNVGGARHVPGTNGADTLFGSRANDSVSSGNGNDFVMGGFGNDRMNAGAGNDRLYGGVGADYLTGSTGSDRFVFRAANESLFSYRDVIADFQEDFDRIDVSVVDARADIAGNQAFTFIGGAAFTAPGQVSYNYYGNNTIVKFNTDLDATAEMDIMIVGRHQMIAADFVL